MQIQQPRKDQQLSRKSKAILYHLKESLKKNNLTLDKFINSFFGHSKQNFKKNQFQSLIRKYDPKLIFSDIDTLFQELDQAKNSIVFYYQLAKSLTNITEDDNPRFNELNRKSKIIQNQSQKNEYQILIQLKDLLMGFQDYLSAIKLFDVQKEGYLTKQSFTEMLNNFDFPQGKKREILFKIVFKKNREKVSIKSLLEVLQLENTESRINLQKMKQDQDIMIQVLPSQYMKSKSKQEKEIQKSIMLQSTGGVDGIISLENIPAQLQPYFNYGSELQKSFAIIAKQFLKHKAVYIDQNNPGYSRAANWVHLSQGMNRDYQLFQVAKSVIHRQKDRKGLGQLLEPKDIIQGKMGDCYFLSALAGIVQKYPQLVYRLFVLQKNPSHIYGVRLFIDGVWKTFVLDVCFPISNHSRFCGAQPHHQQIWVMLLQKAWAKAFKSYDNIHSGYNDQGLIAVSGAPCIKLASKQNGFLKRMGVQINKGAIITCATSSDVGQLTSQQQQQLGIYSSHAYTIMNVFVDVPISQNKKVTLLKVRNPWGKSQWKGDWSYYSSKWTKQLKQNFNFINNPNDGSFFMSYDDFAVYFDHVHVCKVNLAYLNSSIEIKENRNNFATTKFKVNTKGDYFLTIYQENPRKFQKNFSYTKSNSSIFLGRLERGKIIAISSQTSIAGNNSIQVTLDEGEYIILTKVQWKFWDEHQYILASYGPDKIKFQRGLKHSGQQMISQWIQNKAITSEIQPHFYGQTKISKKSFYDPTMGYGFICVTNKDNKALQSTIFLDNCHGVQILDPFKLPINLYVIPGETIVVKFIIDPRGYRFHLRQKIVLHYVQ